MVAHNSSSALALGELNKNTEKLAKDLKKISEGVKITGASDDASGYAISEKMRVQIRGLGQDVQNVQNGTSLLNVASGGVQDIVDELRTLKELAINSANDHNSEIDRKTLQKEFDQRKAHIEDVAVETNYNGIILLDGRWGRSSWGWGAGKTTEISQSATSSTNAGPTTTTTVGPNSTTRIIPPTTSVTTSTSTITSATPPASTGITTTGPVTTSDTTNSTTTTGPTTSSYTSETVSDSSSTKSGKITTVVDKDTTTTTTTVATTTTQIDTTTTKKVTTTTIVSATPVTTVTPASPIIITNGTTSITADGIYEFAPDYTGTLTISASNVEIMGPSSGVTLNDVYMVDNGLKDLYLKNVSVVNTQDKSAIAFDSSTNNTLHLLGVNSIRESPSTPGTIKSKATINVGGRLSIVGNGNLDIESSFSATGAIIGSNDGDSCGDIAIGQSVNISVHSGWPSSAACIGSGGNGASCGNITIGSNAKISAIKDVSYYPVIPGYSVDNAGVAIGAGNSYSSASKCGAITIYSSANVIATGNRGAGIGCSSDESKCGNITVYSDANVNAYSEKSAAIGTGNCGYSRTNPSWDGNPTNTSECGSITVYSWSSGSVNATTSASYAEAIGHGYTIPPRSAYSIVGSINLSNTVNNITGGIADFSEPSLGSTTTTYYDIKTDKIISTETSQLIVETKTIQYETSTEITEAVTTTVYEDGDPEWVEYLHDPLIIHTGTKANQHLRVYIKDMRLEALGVESTKIDPREEAVNALDVIDKAIEYALDTATKLGAYMMELEFTEENLVMAGENTQASESAIRDADMAKEMTNFVKGNVLAQAAQSMLAQANQSSSIVLQLLQ